MNKTRTVILIALLSGVGRPVTAAEPGPGAKPAVENEVRTAIPAHVGGILGERLDAVDQESEDGGRWLDPIKAAPPKPARPSDNSAEDGTVKPDARATAPKVVAPSWRLKSPRKIILAPYFLAGAEGGGVRAMFATKPVKR